MTEAELQEIYRLNLKDVIKSLKIQYGFDTQKEILDILGYKSPSYLSDLLNGVRPITKKFLRRMEEKLGVNPDFIINSRGKVLKEVKPLGVRKDEIQAIIDKGDRIDPKSYQDSMYARQDGGDRELVTESENRKLAAKTLKLGAEIFFSLPENEDDKKFRETLELLNEEEKTELLVGYHHLAQKYYAEVFEHSHRLSELIRKNRVLAEIVSKQLFDLGDTGKK